MPLGGRAVEDDDAPRHRRGLEPGDCTGTVRGASAVTTPATAGRRERSLTGAAAVVASPGRVRPVIDAAKKALGAHRGRGTRREVTTPRRAPRATSGGVPATEQ